MSFGQEGAKLDWHEGAECPLELSASTLSLLLQACM